MDRFEFFAKLPRTEPGSPTFTSAYLTPIPIKSDDKVLDLGCAAGDRATWVARSRCCRVVAVDRDPRYLPFAQQRAAEGGASTLVTPITARYTQLPFADGSFDVVMVEGAALSIGLKQALDIWRRLLSPKGLLAIAYPGVVNKGAPQEVRGPLEKHMVEPLGTLADYHKIIRAAGYELFHQVPLQAEVWDRYYRANQRHAWALIASGEVPEDDATIQDILAEASWYRRVGRGRVFLQAMVVRPR